MIDPRTLNNRGPSAVKTLDRQLADAQLRVKLAQDPEVRNRAMAEIDELRRKLRLRGGP